MVNLNEIAEAAKSLCIRETANLAMDPARIRRIRTELNVSQDDFATILGVRRTMIIRFEAGLEVPSGEAERKLLQLETSLVNPKEKAMLKGVILGAGGVVALASMVSAATALIPLAVLLAGGGGLYAANKETVKSKIRQVVAGLVEKAGRLK